MNLPINDDETMSRHRSEYVNQLLERNRQVGAVFLVLCLAGDSAEAGANQRESPE